MVVALGEPYTGVFCVCYSQFILDGKSHTYTDLRPAVGTTPRSW
jgi:hypothetical protein